VKTAAAGFEAKPLETVQVVLRPNHLQIVDLGFKAQPRNPRYSSPRAQCRPHTAPPDSRPPDHQVPDLCDHLWSSAPGLLLLPRSSSLHAIPHLLPAHHETSKRDSPNETKVKEKQNETIPDSNSNLTKSMTHHNQTKELTTWFLTCTHSCSVLLKAMACGDERRSKHRQDVGASSSGPSTKPKKLAKRPRPNSY
jgi:hypothetical protein